MSDPQFADSLKIGGGYGATGTTLEANGDVLTNGSVITDGDVDVTGTVTAAAFVGDGSGLTGVPAGGSTFSDALFRVQDNGDATKQIAFQASGIGAGTTRTITMPNTDINLADIAVNTAKVSNATHTGDVTGSTVLTIAAGAIDIAMHSATGTPDGTTFYRGDNTWATPAGAGDMTLAGTQTVTGAKTYEDATLILEGSTSGTTTLKANATAGTTTATFQAATGIVALTADIPADTDDLTEGSTNKYATAAEKTKLGYISVTQAVNLDTMESDIASLQGGAGSGVFSDATFRIQDNGDNSKEIAFQASGISAGTVRTITVPDASGTMALTSDALTLTGDVTGSGAGSIATTIAAGAVDIAMLSASGTPSGTTYLRGDNTWATPAGSGDVAKVGTPVDGQIGVWTGDGTIEGDAGLTFDTTDDTLVIAASGKLGFGAVDILSDSAGTMTLQNIDALDATTEATIEAAIDTLANLTSIQGQTVTVSGTTTISGTNTGDVTLAGTPDYITRSGQVLTLGQIDLTTDVTGDLPLANLAQFAEASIAGRAVGAGTGDLTALTLLQVMTFLNTPVAITSTSNSTAWNSDNGRIFTHVMSENTTIAASSGTPFNGQIVLFRIQKKSTYTLAWNAQFRAGTDFSDTIPTINATADDFHYYLFIYNSTDSAFDLLASTPGN